MSADFFGIGGGSDMSYSQMLVESYKKTQAYRVSSLQDRKNDLQKRQSFYNSLNSRINNLIAQLDKFGEYKQIDGSFSFVKNDKIDNSFSTRKATASSNEHFTVSAKGNAIVGASNIKVERLATNDVLVSDRLNLNDKFASNSKGQKVFHIQVGSEKYDIKVDFNGDETNEEAMTKIVNAINNTTDIKVSASVVKDTETTARLSLVSKETGADNRITIIENSIAKTLGWDSKLFSDKSNGRTKMEGTKAGYTRADASELSAKFFVNGIEISRNKNDIDDVLPGLNINLLKPQEKDAMPVSVNTDIDPDGVVNVVDAFVKEFNGLLYYLSQNRDMQKSDPGIGTLQSRLRSIVSSQLMPSDSSEAPRYISDIGFKINNDGTIVVNDKNKLKEYLAKDGGAQMVADLFTSETGFAAKISDAIVNLRPAGDGQIGLIRSRNESIRTQILNLDRRIATVESSIEQQANTMRKEYENYLKVFLQAQGQYSLLSTMPAPSGGYNSLLANQTMM